MIFHFYVFQQEIYVPHSDEDALRMVRVLLALAVTPMWQWQFEEFEKRVCAVFMLWNVQHNNNQNSNINENVKISKFGYNSQIFSHIVDLIINNLYIIFVIYQNHCLWLFISHIPRIHPSQLSGSDSSMLAEPLYNPALLQLLFSVLPQCQAVHQALLLADLNKILVSRYVEC